MRPRLLLIAYCCSPDGGSEQGVGWTLAQLAAQQFDTTVVVEERKFAATINDWLAENGPIENLTFRFVPEKWWAHGMWATGLGYLSYRWWQRRARRTAEDWHRQQPFDAVQMGTIISFREPGNWLGLKHADGREVPLIWGPVGGAQSYPEAFLSEAGPRASFKERVRTALNRRQLRSGRVLRTLRGAHTVVAATRHTERVLSEVHDREYRMVSEITLGERKTAMPPRESAADELRVLWSGLHEPRKCLSLLIRAVAKLPDDRPVRVRVLGDGEMRGRWQKLARDLGVSDRFEWLGWMPHEETARQYAWADVFAFTSVRDTTGTVILEALQAGLPVVTLDHQGAADVITADCGIAVSPASIDETVKQLRDALLRLAIDDALRCRLSAGAVRRADAYRVASKSQQWQSVWSEVPGLSVGEGGVKFDQSADQTSHASSRDAELLEASA